MNISIRHVVVLLFALSISSCVFFRFSPKVDNVPWRSEISQQGCPDISGRYKDPEDVLFDAFYAEHTRGTDRSNNRISGHQYIEYPYSSLPWKDGYKAMLKFNRGNSVNVNIDGSVITLKEFNKGILYNEVTRKLNYFMVGCWQGNYVFRYFSSGPGGESRRVSTYVLEHYIKKERDGSLVIDRYSRRWGNTSNLGSKPREDKHSRYVLEPVREQ